MTCQDFRWDYNKEITAGFVVPDQGSIGVGTRINPEPSDARVARMRIFLDIIHDVPSSLDIAIVHDQFPDTMILPETLVIWDNDYPGDIQETDLEYFIGWPVEGNWGISIIDEVEDGNGALLSEFILMVRYQ